MNKVTPIRTLAAVAVGLSVVLTGCATTPTHDPDFAAVRPRPPHPPAPTAGAIYRVGYGMELFRDLRAHRVGDVLTVRLTEKTAAKKASDTTIKKTNTTTITNPTVLGSAVQFGTPAVLPLASHSNNNLGASLSSSTDFSGQGDANQSNSLTGDITVTVAEVLPNGDLVVQGEKAFTLNRGDEYVRISGVVRQADIAADNTIVSPRVANARIIYTGKGQSADANVLGWLGRFFISALFPF